MKRIAYAGVVAAVLWASTARADGIETAGTVLQWVLPASAIALTVVHEDYEGFRQFAKAGAFTGVTTLVLKHSIDATRPNGGGKAFPSGHTAAAFAGASFIARRYGWRLGLPAYGLAGFVAWSRVESQQHDVKDVAAGAAIAVLSTYIFTDRLPKGVQVIPTIDTRHYGILISGVW